MSGTRVMADAGPVAFEEWNSSLKSCDGWSEERKTPCCRIRFT
jgi:hypothetical protein